ncbi:peptidase aspartic active site, partial [Trifolium medium]|nr:peptidase aspartic active site [Trifolium medium]
MTEDGEIVNLEEVDVESEEEEEVECKLTGALGSMGLTITPTTAKSIRLGDGHGVSTKGVCKGVKMKMRELEVIVDALVLELGGMNMVLGVAWLSTLGKVVMDWKDITMQFSYNNKLIKLQGQATKSKVHKDLESILAAFPEVFRDNIQLPPHRSQVHHIKLYPEHGAINVRPYRYPHHQKEEIERHVAELLK